MRVWAKLYKDNIIINDVTGSSENAEVAEALLECLEQIYQELDLAEPIWLSKHTRDFSVFRRTKLYPSDFMEKVHFDYCEFIIL